MTANNGIDSQANSVPAYEPGKRNGGSKQRSSAGGSASANGNAKTKGTSSALQDDRKPSKRGFAAMDSARQREIAAQGGRAAHESGNAHQFTVEEARAAGKKSHSSRQQRTAQGASL